MGSYLITLYFCNFRGKEYYLISLRSVHIQILAKIRFVNSKHCSRSNGTKGNFKPRKYLLLNSVLQAVLSVTCFSEGLAGSRTGLENVFNVILARQNSGDIYIGLEDIKSQQANNINLSLNHIIEPSTFLMNHKIHY